MTAKAPFGRATTSNPFRTGRRVQRALRRHHDVARVQTAQQLRRRLAGHDLAPVHDGDGVAQLLRLLQIVGGQQDGHALGIDAADVFPELATQFDVHPGGRLVQDQDRRIVDQGLGHHQPPLHAARQGPDIGMGLVRQAERGQQFVAAALVGGHAIEAGLDLQRLARGEEDVGDDLLRHDAQGGAGVARLACRCRDPRWRRCPPVLLTTPARMLISVDLPAPLGPSRPNIEPRGMTRSTPRSAVLGGDFLVPA